MSLEDTHSRKPLCLQDVSRDILKHHEKIQEKSPLPVGYATRSLLIGSTRNVMQRYTQVKSPLPAGYAMKHSETLSVDTPKRKALSLLDV